MSHLTRNTAICNMLYVNRDKHNDHPFQMILGMTGLHKSSKTSETFVKIHGILHWNQTTLCNVLVLLSLSGVQVICRIIGNS